MDQIGGIKIFDKKVIYKKYNYIFFFLNHSGYNTWVLYKIKDKFGNDDYISIAYEVNDHYLLNSWRLYDILQNDPRFSNIFELIDKINN